MLVFKVILLIIVIAEFIFALLFKFNYKNLQNIAYENDIENFIKNKFPNRLLFNVIFMLIIVILAIC